MEMFQTESAYDSELFLESDLNPFRNVLGADAAMFTIVKSWKKSTIGGKITVGIEYILRSTKTGETLYNRDGLITLDTSISGAGGGLFPAYWQTTYHITTCIDGIPGRTGTLKLVEWRHETGCTCPAYG